MKLIQNEKAYTLLLTMIIIFIIIIFFSSFAFSAMNQQKQVENTDDTYEVTAIAEMGVEYYQAQIHNLVKENILATLIELNDNELLDKSKKRSVDVIKTENFKKLKINIENLYIDFNKINLEVENNKYFELVVKPNFQTDLFLEIQVRGNIKNKHKVITASFNFAEELVTIKNTPSPTTTELVKKPKFEDTIPKINPDFCPKDPDQNTAANLAGITCKSDTLKNINNFNNSKVFFSGNSIPNNTEGKDFYNSTLYVLDSNSTFTFSQFNGSTKNLSLFIDRDSTFTQDINDPSNFLIQSTKDIKINGSIQNFNLMKIYINGSLNMKSMNGSNLELFIRDSFTVKDNINGISSSNMEVNGDASFNYITLSNNSKLHVKGTLSANMFELNNSKLYLDSNFSTDNEIRVQNGSTLCLRNTFNIKKLNTDYSSNVYALLSNKQKSFFNLYNSQKSPIFLSEAEFNQHCNIGGITSRPEYVENLNNYNFINQIIYN